MKDSARLYLAATNEVDQDRMNKAIWEKAMALEQGDAKRAKYTYIQLRVKQFERALARSGPKDDTRDESYERDLGNVALLRFVWAALKTPWFIGQLMPQRGF
jgi:hypothetical protein